MIPCSGVPYGTLSASSSAFTSATIFLICAISDKEVIIGYMIAMLPNALARNSARSCVLKISGLVRQIRMARTPIAGFSSFANSK